MTSYANTREWWYTAFDLDTWDDLRFPANAINPTGLTDAMSIETDEAEVPGSLLATNTKATVCAGVAQLPHDCRIGAGAEIRPHIHWQKTTSATGGVVWEFRYRLLGNVGGDMGAWSDADNGTLAVSHNNSATRHALTAFTAIPLTSSRESAMIAWRLYRRPGGSDNYAANVRLLEVDFHYQKQAGKRGTYTEYPDVG